MDKKHFMILLTILAVVISGCTDGGSKGKDTTKFGAQGSPFIGGTEGLKIEFLDGAPPNEVFDSGTFPFDVNLKVQNVGEADISKDNVTLEIVGIDPGDFGKNSTELKGKIVGEDLRGAQRDAEGNDLPGSITNVEFTNFNFGGKVTGNPEFILRANVCYGYKTRTIAQLCVLEDLIGRTRKSGEEAFCNPNEDKEVSNSGGPIQITNFKQNVAGKDKVSFTFNVEHKGDKENRISEPRSKCDIEIKKKDRVKVKVDAGIAGTTCSGLSALEGGVPADTTDGYVKLFGEKGGSEERAVFCTVPLVAGRTDFNKQVKIEIEYDYKQHIEKPLIVKHTE